MLRSVILCSALLLFTSCSHHKVDVKEGIIKPSELYGKTNHYFGCHDEKGEVTSVVNFAFDKSDLSNSAKAVIQSMVDSCILPLMDKDAKIEIVATGHTDRHGTSEYNIALGTRRANAVKSFLVSYLDTKVNEMKSKAETSCDISKTIEDYNANIGKQMINITSKGKEDLLNTNDDPEADFENRRVVLSIKVTHAPVVAEHTDVDSTEVHSASNTPDEATN